MLGNSRTALAVPLLRRVLLDEEQSPLVREQAACSIARLSAGEEELIEIARRGDFPLDLEEVAGAAMAHSMRVYLGEEAAKLFPVPPLKNSEPLPQMTDLLVHVGDPKRGAEVFDRATCSDC